MAAQFTLIKGPALLRLSRWIEWANNSLPVPLSPEINTVESLGATRRAIALTAFNLGLSPIMSSNP